MKKKSIYRTFVEREFSAAHELRGYENLCGKLHGHTWKVRVEVETEKLDKIGISIDFRDLKVKLDSIIKNFDHKFLNENPAFIEQNPTAENLAKEVYNKLKELLPSDIKICEVTVWESPNSGVKYLEK